MLALAVSSTLSLYLCIICGFSITKFAKLPLKPAEKILLGLAAANTLTTIISLFYPVNFSSVAGLVTCSLPLLYYTRSEFGRLFSLNENRKVVLLWSLPFIMLAFMASLGPPRPFDTGLYHLQTVKWIEEYAVVPGLANLHGRFGFNPNIFTFFAATSLADIFKQEIFAVNFSIYAIVVIYFIHKIRSLFNQYGVTNILIFNLILFIDILFTIQNLSSPSPNFITAILPFFILADTCTSPECSHNAGLKAYVPIIALCGYVLTVKLASIPLMLLVLFILIKYREERRTIIWLCAGMVVIVTPWLIRNIVLSGWLIYPFPTIDLFPFDWKVPLAKVVEEKMHVTGWARNPGLQDLAAARMGISEWFPIWWHRIVIEHKILFSAALVAPLIAAVLSRCSGSRNNYFAGAVTATAFMGVLFWFLLAPAIQFGEPFLVTAAASPFLFWDFTIVSYGKQGERLLMVIGVVVFILLGVQVQRITRVDFTQTIVRPQRIQIPEEVSFTTFSTTNSVHIFTPTAGACCFDHPLPCTPFPDSNLELRATSLQSGFRHVLR